MRTASSNAPIAPEGVTLDFFDQPLALVEPQPRSASQQLAWQRLCTLLLAPLDTEVAATASAAEVA